MNRDADFSKLSNETLFELLSGGVRRDQYELADHELHRRYLQEIGKQTAILAVSSHRLEELTTGLIDVTAKVHHEVGLLADSSDRLEKLTATLKSLTWALILLTVLAALVPIGIEIWHALHETPVPRAQQTVPQTPVP
jgi:hypothetical protein